MKPYTVDDIDIIVAKMSLVLFILAIFGISYNILLEYKNAKTIVYYEIGLALFTTINVVQSVRHFINHTKHKTIYLRVDQDGVFMNGGELHETVPWEQIKEIYFRNVHSRVHLYLYHTNDEDIYIFDLNPYIDGINLFSLRRALRHFSGRKDIVKNRSLIFNKD